MRINVQLIDAATDEHLWAQIYDRPLTTDNLFAIQSEISEAIAAALQAALTPDEQRRIQQKPTENLAAYSAYLRGQRDFGRREFSSMKQALDEFRQAVALDPDFAQAWAGIAQVAQVMPSWGLMPAEEAQAISRPAAQKALELAPDQGESNLAMALVLEGEESEAWFRKAIELLPNYAPAYQWYANTIEDDLERSEEALACFAKRWNWTPCHRCFATRWPASSCSLATSRKRTGKSPSSMRRIRTFSRHWPGALLPREPWVILTRPCCGMKKLETPTPRVRFLTCK